MTGLAGTAFLAHRQHADAGEVRQDRAGGRRVPHAVLDLDRPDHRPGQDSGMPMHGHGFALMFLASVYGMITKTRSAARWPTWSARGST